MTFRNSDAAKFITQVNNKQKVQKNAEKSQAVFNKYKHIVDKETNINSLSKLVSTPSRGYENITKKSKEDLIQVVERLKQEINHKNNEVKFLKIKLNKGIENQSTLNKLKYKERPRSAILQLNEVKDKKGLEEELDQLKKLLHKEKQEKNMVKTEFNRMREFLGKVKKERYLIFETWFAI